MRRVRGQLLGRPRRKGTFMGWWWRCLRGAARGTAARGTAAAAGAAIIFVFVFIFVAVTPPRTYNSEAGWEERVSGGTSASLRDATVVSADSSSSVCLTL